MRELGEVARDILASELDDADGLAVAAAGRELVDRGELLRQEPGTVSGRGHLLRGRMSDTPAAVAGHAAHIEAEHAGHDPVERLRNVDVADATAIGVVAVLHAQQVDLEQLLHRLDRAARLDVAGGDVLRLDGEARLGQRVFDGREIVRVGAVAVVEVCPRDHRFAGDRLGQLLGAAQLNRDVAPFVRVGAAEHLRARPVIAARARQHHVGAVVEARARAVGLRFLRLGSRREFLDHAVCPSYRELRVRDDVLEIREAAIGGGGEEPGCVRDMAASR